MKKLILIRHAKSDWDFKTSDFNRSITEKGSKDAISVAKKVIKLLPQDYQVWSSAANRATQTALLFTKEFNYPCNNDFLRRVGKPGINPLMDHVARKHNDLDRERFRMMIANHWSFGELRKKMPQYEHEHARVFDNSYVVQWWNLPSKTILAHIHKDGFQFIHPDGAQARSFTVREAARIQSFPDDFEFKGSRGEKYKQIGNAVPPLFAEALAISIKKNLKDIKL